MQVQKAVTNRWVAALFTGIRRAPGQIAVALAYRNFRLLWMGALTSSIGTWMQKVAEAWLIVTITESRSAFYLGVDSFLGELPLLLFSMIGGVIADRHDRRSIILASQTIQMLIALLLATLVATKRIHVTHVLILSFIAGCARAFGGPAYQSLLPVLVGREHVPNAIALNSVQFNLAQVIGPFAAGVALSTLGMVACFGLNGISFLFVIGAMLALRDVPASSMVVESMGSEFRNGLRFVRGSRSLVSVIAVGFFSAFLGVPLLTFLPVITRSVFHRDVVFYTQLLTFSGAGAVLGALMIAWLGQSRHMGRVLLILLAPFGMVIAGFGLSRRACVSVLLLFTGASLFVMCSSLATSLAQLLAPPKMRGRVVSFFLVAFLGGSSLGNLASGWMMTQVGSAPVVLAVDGTALTLVALNFLIRGHCLQCSPASLGRTEHLG